MRVFPRDLLEEVAGPSDRDGGGASLSAHRQLRSAPCNHGGLGRFLLWQACWPPGCPFGIKGQTLAMNRPFYGDQGHGDGIRHNGLLSHNLAPQYCGRFSNSGSLAMLMAMRRASSRVIRFAADRLPGSFS